jgi:DNA-binding response OmpR family regulator
MQKVNPHAYFRALWTIKYVNNTKQSTPTAISTGSRVLVVDNDTNIRDSIIETLRRSGFLCTTAETAAHATFVLSNYRPDLMILDLNLPDGDGLELLKTLRGYDDLPVIICTDRGEEDARILGFESGADDYVTKPFSPLELAHRAKSVLKRSNTKHKDVLTCEGIDIDIGARLVTCLGAVISLTTCEFDLLLFMVRNQGVVFTRNDLLKHVWKVDKNDRSPATVTEHIRRLRKKIGDSPNAPRHIKAIRGIGYRFDF